MAFDFVTNSSEAVLLFTTNNPLPALPTASAYIFDLSAVAVGTYVVSSNCK